MEFKIEPSWNELLKKEFAKSYFNELLNFVEKEYLEAPLSIFPPKNQIFRAFQICPVENVKVVIIGQDPYPTKGYANGLCFSLNPTVKPLAKSLINIFKEIESDVTCPIPSNGDLSRWSEQGVLLLNSILTVREGQPLSHQNKGWEKFTDAVIEQLVLKKEGIVFLLWGSKAIEKVAHLNMANHLVLTSVHPSPLSAYRGFFGCKHFSRTNEYLKKTGKSEIYWGD